MTELSGTRSIVTWKFSGLGAQASLLWFWPVSGEFANYRMLGIALEPAGGSSRGSVSSATMVREIRVLPLPFPVAPEEGVLEDRDEPWGHGVTVRLRGIVGDVRSWPGPREYLDQHYGLMVPEEFRDLRDKPAPERGDGVKLALYLALIGIERAVPPLAWSPELGVHLRLFSRQCLCSFPSEVRQWALSHPDLGLIREELEAQWEIVQQALAEREHDGVYL